MTHTHPAPQASKEPSFASRGYRQGLILVGISALTFSTAGLFTKGVTATAWQVIFWRGLAAFGFTLVYLIGQKRLRAEIKVLCSPKGLPGILASLMMALGTLAFIPAFKLTSVAHVALIYASVPFMAAVLAWSTLREAPSVKVVIASGLAMLGVMVIVSTSSGSASLLGDGLALIMTFMLASVMVIYRAFPDTPAALPSALSSLLLLPLSWAWGNPLMTPAHEIWILLAFGLVFALASVTLNLGAQRLPPADTALLSALEVPLAPILAWLILHEHTSTQTMVGGALIIIAVIGSQWKSKTPN